MTVRKPQLMDIMSKYTLEENEEYNLYFFRTDAWPWGFVCSSKNPQDIQDKIDREIAGVGKHSIIGIWVTKESGNGLVDVTIYRQENIRR